jgi:hypothetical protein
MGLEVAVEKMGQASSQILVGCRGSLIQACPIFLGFAPTPSTEGIALRECGCIKQGCPHFFRDEGANDIFDRRLST